VAIGQQVWTAPSRGATVRVNSQTINPSAGYTFDWDIEDVDTDGFFNAAGTLAQRQEFVIPAGVTKVKLSAMIYINSSITSGQIWTLSITKNNIYRYNGGTLNGGQIGYGNILGGVATGVVDVVPGDIFRCFCQSPDTSVTLDDNLSWYQIEVVEGDPDVLLGSTLVTALDTELGSAAWQTQLTGTEIVTALDTELGQTAWKGAMTQTELTASHVVVDADLAGNVVRRMNNAAALTVTVNTGLTGTEVATWIQTGAGQVTFVQGAGVTLLSADGLLATRAQYSSVSLIPDSTTAETYYLVGDLA